MAPVPIAIFVEKCYNFGNIFIYKLAARFWGRRIKLLIMQSRTP